MQFMESTPFLAFDEQPISLTQALRYLQVSEKQRPFILEILRPIILEQEIQTREDLDISPTVSEDAVIDFRLEQQLTDPKTFQEWLISNDLDYFTFHSFITFKLKLEKLKAEVTEPKLQKYFIDRKIFQDQVVLSRKQELVNQLFEQWLSEKMQSFYRAISC